HGRGSWDICLPSTSETKPYARVYTNRRFLPQHDCTWPKNRPSLDLGQLQEVLEGRAQRRIVLDDEHQGLGVRHAPSSLPRGSVNCTTAPWGTLAVAHSRPPCASIIRRLIANPSPSPCGLVV